MPSEQKLENHIWEDIFANQQSLIVREEKETTILRVPKKATLNLNDVLDKHLYGTSVSFFTVLQL